MMRESSSYLSSNTVAQIDGEVKEADGTHREGTGTGGGDLQYVVGVQRCARVQRCLHAG